MTQIPTPALDETYFQIDGKNVFGKTFLKVLSFQEGFATVQDESGWYHIDLNGEPCYKKRYTRAFGFYFGRASVVENQSFFHITSKFEREYPQNYKWCGNYMEGVCTVKDFDDKYFHIDLFGSPIYEKKFLYAGDFYSCVASVMLENGKFSHITKTGKFLYNFSALFLGVYHKGYALAYDAEGWFFIDKKGHPLTKEKFSYLEPFYNGIALGRNLKGQLCLVKENGEVEEIQAPV